MKLLLKCSLAAVASLIALGAPHAAVVYTYTGQNFSANLAAPYTNTSHLTGSLTFASALAPNLSAAVISGLPAVTSISFFDGVNSYISPNVSLNPFGTFTTNAQGLITAWAIQVVGGTNSSQFISRSALTTTSSCGNIAAVPGGVNDAVCAGAFPANVFPGSLQPGSWSAGVVSAVPEPATWLLFGLGLAGVLRRKRADPSAVKFAQAGSDSR